MALNLHSLRFTILLILAVTVFSDVSAALGGPNLGGWKPIKNTKDPSVVEIGQFAINEHNKEAKSGLKFQEIVKGETQVVSGMNYKLVISAKDGSASHQYEAVVWDKPWEKFRSLTSFKQI
ncbi:hypothetical protein M9H77_11598 [Catharanthus roseus]|uniref:Uncharacterized protein n=1 Tax=Catharanthus roseus TaxID=4058 RepID=A0ACC0BF17_CATRO|nr:hypothetical protein M9H77_11598 [Catharanthus roseus]